MFDMNSLMSKIQEAQQKMKEAQENLVNISTEGESGGGMVKAKVNGKRQLTGLDIDPEIISKDDKEMIEDLTVAAINNALEKIEEKIQEEMKKTTGGILPDIPGLDPSKMM